MKPRILSKRGTMPGVGATGGEPAPPLGGKQSSHTGQAADRGHGTGGSAARPAAGVRATVQDEGSGPRTGAGGEGTVGQGRPPGGQGARAKGQMGPGHLYRALLLKGMTG